MDSICSRDYWMENSNSHPFLDLGMTDSIFQPGDQRNVMILSPIKRSDGSIPYARRANQVYSTSKVKAPLSSGVNPSNSGLYQAGTVSPTGGLQNVGNT